MMWFKRLRLLRAAAELTQSEMAGKLGVQQRVYWGWEQGEHFPRPFMQECIAFALGVDVETIFAKTMEGETNDSEAGA
jgi:transcriptional regulator with XRE-family HTH domain